MGIESKTIVDQLGDMLKTSLRKLSTHDIRRVATMANQLGLSALAQLDDKESNECTICASSPKTHAFQPCGHYCSCLKCAKKIQKGSGVCPICRVKITDARPIFL